MFFLVLLKGCNDFLKGLIANEAVTIRIRLIDHL